MTRAEQSDILIVGGGIAGLALARFLRQRGKAPLIAEQAPQWRDQGYGIGLWKKGIEVLRELGCLDEARQQAAEPEEFVVRSAGGGVLSQAQIPPEKTALMAIYRGDLHAALREGVPDGWVQMGTAPRRIDEEGEKVNVAFEDGTTESFRLVVGADGIHSAVRQLRFTDWTRNEYDTYVWSLWVPQDIEIGGGMVSVWGPGSEGFVVCLGDRVGFNLAAQLDHTPEPPAKNELQAQAEAIGWKLPLLLGGATGEPFFDRVRDVTCRRWHAGRTVLIGDAAHAVHPISGMGASLALQDARALAEEIGAASLKNPAPALSRFEERRRGPAARVQREARLEANVMFLESGPLRWLRNKVVKHTPLMELFIQQQLNA
ncbi:FAD-dependent oxidoreductase [Salinibacter sp.]|uniref:FAD-dependent oxidoreductase n=1 Tax=Salinibacter sp. TaxID=2065818 RepID=UPI0021E6E243|nr:NAD(P)/FAD-dependent oxidoreductase [Salinibacter sp.]